VDSSKLRPWQARKIFGSLHQATGYLSRLKRRMEATRFPPNDELCVSTAKALEAMQDLLMELHRLSTESAVWREPRRPEK
jgi:hypothetical protein